ncbi:MAG: DUF3863 domain-containing protein [Acidobacteriota bacterium]
MPITRRHFLSTTAAALATTHPAFATPASRYPEALASGLTAAPEKGALAPGANPTPLRGRFLTHISVVRVNQIEVTPTRNIGQDEAPDNSPARIRSRCEAFRRGAPNGRMTWAISWSALQDQRPDYIEARRLLASFHDKYNDEITFIPGGYFAPMFNTREQTRQTINSALAQISTMVGNHYRPQSLVAGYMDSQNMHDLAHDHGIHVCQGQIWSQHGIDNGDGDGGICYPYYPSREHYLKPAQSPADFIDSVCLDGWTCDFLTARREGFQGHFNSRLGVGPIESVGHLGLAAGRKEMLDTTAMHFDRGHQLNGFAFVTGIWETSLGHDEDLTYWLQSIHTRWPDTQVLTEGAFGLEWRKHYRDNSTLNYRFDARGTGAPGSEPNLELQWFMNQKFRLALLQDHNTAEPPKAIDFTRYDLPAHEPTGLQREWSLFNVLNQKSLRPQDHPTCLSALSAEDQRIIFHRYPELKARSC